MTATSRSDPAVVDGDADPSLDATLRRDVAFAATLSVSAKPLLSLVIARCVEPGERPGRQLEPAPGPAKLSQRRFAKLAGIDHKTVGAYLATWELLAEQGHVPQPSDLRPGQYVDLPPPEVWRDAYREVSPTRPKPPPLQRAARDLDKLVTRLEAGIGDAQLDDLTRLALERVRDRLDGLLVATKGDPTLDRGQPSHHDESSPTATQPFAVGS